MPRAIGVDVGGTGVRAAIVDDVGHVGSLRRRALDDRRVETVVASVTDLASELGADSIGVGVPGFVRDGVVLASPNFRDWTGVDLANLLQQSTGKHCHVENDANCATWGAHQALGRPRHMVALTLGTGIGGGMVIDGELRSGSRGTGAELGHIYAGGDQLCGCGARGCLETWAGTAGLQQRSGGADGKQLLERARAGDDQAISWLSEAGEGLGRGLATLVNVLNPEKVALMGGLTEARAFIEDRMLEVLVAQGIAANTTGLDLQWLDRADAYAIAGAAALSRRA